MPQAENQKSNIEEEDSEVCEFCGGTGEVSTMESVYAGEPHMADIGSEACICQMRDEDDYDPDDDD